MMTDGGALAAFCRISGAAGWRGFHVVVLAGRSSEKKPGYFCKRVRKALKTKDGRSKKSDKRVEECASDWRERR